MKTNLLIGGTLLAAAFVVRAATNDLSSVLQRGLFEEEANHDLSAAIKDYQAVASQFDKDRKLAATAIFRLGECYRKQGDTNAANGQYQRILREFSDQAPLVALSREYAGGGVSGLPQSVLGDLPSLNLASDEVQRIRALIKDSPDLINAPDKNGETLLEAAAAKGKLAIVKLLLESGAAVNGIQEPGLTPLHYAAANGHKAVVDLLLANGAKVDARTSGGVTPLHLAVRKGYETVAKTLLDAGASVNARAGSQSDWETEDLRCRILSGQTPLHIAADSGYTALLDLLISRGAAVNVPDGSGQTALTYAAQKHYEAALKLLLAAHADPNAGSLNSPLAVAAFYDDLPALKLLLANGADPNTNSKVNWTLSYGGLYYPGGTTANPLFFAANAHHAEAITELVRFKANPNGLSPNRDPLLFEGLWDLPTLRALLEAGADPNQPDRNGTPALFHLATSSSDGSAASAQLLLAHHARPDVVVERLEDGGTPLHAAAKTGNKALAELLLKNGAEVNARNKTGATPLHVAAEHRTRETVELLLANSADSNARDKAGNTPLDFAKRFEVPGGPAPAGIHQVTPNSFPGTIPPGFPGAIAPGSPLAPAPALSIADLLRQHGALEDLPHMDRIEMTRASVHYSETVFSKGTNDYNHFTLLEFIAAHYGLVSTDPGPEPTRQRLDYSYVQTHGPYATKGLHFPDLAKVAIHRPTPDGRRRKTIPVDLEAIFNSGDCSRDLALQWGDAVEIPEADHPISATWQGLPSADLLMLSNCLQRQVSLTVKGQTTNLVLALFNLPQTAYGQTLIFPGSGGVIIPQFSLLPVLNNSGLLRASSDLSRVKVSRRDAATGQRYGLVIDCSNPSRPPDLWLRDGDKIEVPERSEGPASAANPAPNPETDFQRRLREIQERAGASAPTLPTIPARTLRPPPASSPPGTNK